MEPRDGWTFSLEELADIAFQLTTMEEGIAYGNAKGPRTADTLDEQYAATCELSDAAANLRTVLWTEFGVEGDDVERHYIDGIMVDGLDEKLSYRMELGLDINVANLNDAGVSFKDIADILRRVLNLDDDE
jgi:hypothetical protein